MKFILDTMDELLKAYERTTPSIDQKLVNRVLMAKAAVRIAFRPVWR